MDLKRFEEDYIASARHNTDMSDFAIWYDDKKRNYHSGNYICHAPMSHKSLDGAKWVFSNTAHSSRMQEVVDKFWEVFCQADSPHRILFKNGLPERLIHKGNTFGFKLDVSGLDEINKPDPWVHNLLYNFMVLMRMPHEYPDTIRGWKRFVDEGVNPCDALYLSRCFSIQNDLCLVSLSNDGSHWPLNEWNVTQNKINLLDFEKFKTGNPNQYIPMWGQTQCWVTALSFRGKAYELKTKIRFNDNLDGLEKTERKGRFSKKVEYKIEDVIDHFKKYVEKHQELLKIGEIE